MQIQVVKFPFGVRYRCSEGSLNYLNGVCDIFGQRFSFVKEISDIGKYSKPVLLLTGRF